MSIGRNPWSGAPCVSTGVTIQSYKVWSRDPDHHRISRYQRVLGTGHPGGRRSPDQNRPGGVSPRQTGSVIVPTAEVRSLRGGGRGIVACPAVVCAWLAGA